MIYKKDFIQVNAKRFGILEWSYVLILNLTRKQIKYSTNQAFYTDKLGIPVIGRCFTLGAVQISNGPIWTTSG